MIRGKDMKLNFKWKKKTGQYQQGDYLYVNKIHIGGYDWNSARPRHEAEIDDSARWVGYIELPSLADKSKRVYGANPDEVKTQMERVVTDWFTEALREGE